MARPCADTNRPERVLSSSLAAICLAYFMVSLDATIVNVALPALRADLGTGVSALQWVVDGYTLMFAALLLSGGALADNLGARRVFRAGLWLFVAASTACGVAPSAAALVLARLAQGVGAALAVPASLALLRAGHPDPGLRARAVGAWGAIAGIAAASGPVLGGLLVAAASWRLVFFVNVPIGLAALALSARHVPAPAPRPRGLDPAAQATAFAGLAALTIALIEAGRAGATAAPVVAAFAVLVLAAVAFVAVERRAANPMLPPGLFASPTFSGGTVVGLLINLGFYGQLFVVNLYLQEVRHLSPLLAGLAVLPEAGPVSLASALSGRFTARAGSPRPTMLIGLTLGGAGLLGLMVAGPATPYAALVVPLAAAGAGMAFTMPAATTAVVDAAPAERAGIASGVINAARQVGAVIGVALLGSLVAGSDGVVGRLRLAMAAAGAAFLAGASVTLVAVDRSPRYRRTPEPGGASPLS
jgi:DHA2 family methylenomycin A resistance protein-like MFS transporter